MPEMVASDRSHLPLVLRVHPHLTGILGLCKVKVYELAQQEDFPAIRIGRSIRIPRDAFFRWLDNQVQGD